MPSCQNSFFDFFSSVSNMSKEQSKPFQWSIAEAILGGKLDDFRRLGVNKYDINRRMSLPDTLAPRPQSGGRPCIKIDGPTVVMYTILCEQAEILQYILDEKSPDLSIYVDGLTALHIAAMTKDWRCLAILRQYKFIQDYIDMEEQVKGIRAEEGNKTTALHSAVSNKRLHNVVLLLSSCPVPKDGKEEGVDPTEQRGVANVGQKSATGNTPLYLAVKVRAPDIVRVLLAADADATEPCAGGVTPLQLAEKLKNEADQRAEKAGKARGTQEDSLEKQILDLLEAPREQFEVLTRELCPELYPELCLLDENNDDDEQPEKPGGAMNDATVSEILRLLRDLDRRLRVLEAAPRAATVVAPPPMTSVTTIHQCCVCGDQHATECRQCHNWYCETHWTKEGHTCPRV